MVLSKTINHCLIIPEKLGTFSIPPTSPYLKISLTTIFLNGINFNSQIFLCYVKGEQNKVLFYLSVK